MKYQKLIEDICQAALSNKQHLLAHYSRVQNNDHTNIELFQDGICKYLNYYCDTFKWKTEVKLKGRSEKDSIDIMGDAKQATVLPCIIEIDACRHDQVATKFLSRLALWGTKKPIVYVAVMYKSTQKNNCEKYIRFASSIIKLINNNSIVVGIYVDVDGAPHYDNRVEIWDFNKTCPFPAIFRTGGIEYKSMTDCASAAIKRYVGAHPQKTYADLQVVFGKYIDSKIGPSRYKPIKDNGKIVKSKDGVDLFSYTQWRQFGPQAYWSDFVKICKANKIVIEMIWPCIR